MCHREVRMRLTSHSCSTTAFRARAGGHTRRAIPSARNTIRFAAGILLLCCFLLWTLPATATVTAQAVKSAPIQYNRDVRLILTENCFSCHGPDHNKRLAGLRLDIREAALARKAFVPGKPEKSNLIARIFAKPNGAIMPPAFSHKHLTQAQKEVLLQWVRQGAKYEPHWAFVPLPAHVAVASVKDTAWPRNEIDRFVKARLEQEGVRPSSDAGKVVWLRRVTLDLINVPPTPAEVDAFLRDHSSQAYEHIVDRLLSSPHYGERMALPWLDVARYADSYGYQSDQLSPTWPFRDWVVKAFNDNLSYDKFITWQLAGDLLPNATRDQRLATAFNRLHRMTNEGGSVAEEWRIEGVADRVKTFGSAFLGLTTECARCHDHKFDPISQRDYYSLGSFFNNIDEYGLYDQSSIVPSPSLLLPTPDQEKELTATRNAVQASEKDLVKLEGDREAAFHAWLALPHTAALPDMTGKFDFEKFDGARLVNLVPGATETGESAEAVPLVEGHSGKGIEFDGENNVHFPALGHFTRYTPFTIAFWMRDPRLVEGAAVVFQACDGTDAGPYGYDLLAENGRLTARMFRHWPGNAIAVQTVNAIPKDAWTHVVVMYDGSSRANGLHIYVDGKPAAVDVVRDKLYKGTGIHTLVFGQRFRDRGFKGGRIDDLALFSHEATPLEIGQLFDGHALEDALSQPLLHEADLRRYYLSAIDDATRKNTMELAKQRERMVNAEDASFEVPVMEEMPTPRPTYLLARGRYDAAKTEADRVERETPGGILPFPKGTRRDRLGLAQWLTLPNHPLTARVAVNRIWAIFFGKGLVESVEDFGLQGKQPTHPELLDWMARDFIQSGWDVKRLVKKMVLSSTYRQASSLRPDLLAHDPQNMLLARGPSQRLSAEAIRDTALEAAGLIDDRMGGPPVSPYQPGDLWRESNSMSPAFQQSVGKDLYRRSLYTVWKRTAPMPNMIAFDAGSREVCTARRQVTNTPLQALVLMDDPQFVEAARKMAERTLKEAGPTPTARARFAFRLLAVREPTEPELKLLVALYKEQQKLFTETPTEAAKLIKIGASPADAALPSTELAAATVLAQTILNLDATVWKR